MGRKRGLKCGILGVIASSILLTGLMAPHDAFAEGVLKKSFAVYDDCAKCPSDNLDKKSDPDRKGHKVKKTPVKKEPPKKDPPTKEPQKKAHVKKDPPKKVAPKPPAKKK